MHFLLPINMRLDSVTHSFCFVRPSPRAGPPRPRTALPSPLGLWPTPLITSTAPLQVLQGPSVPRPGDPHQRPGLVPALIILSREGLRAPLQREQSHLPDYLSEQTFTAAHSKVEISHGGFPVRWMLPVELPPLLLRLSDKIPTTLGPLTLLCRRSRESGEHDQTPVFFFWTRTD